KGRGGLVVRSRLWGQWVPGSRPDSTEDPPCTRGLLHAKSYVVAKRPPAGVAWKLGEGVPAQVPSSSSDRGSKLRGPSQNSPRVASKQDVNITKLNSPFQVTYAQESNKKRTAHSKLYLATAHEIAPRRIGEK
ncbi:hypothetical protein AVEN_10064-1, partial [Araneus ventricosus]